MTERKIPDTEVLSIAQCAALLGTTEKAIRRRVDRRHLPFRRLGRRIIFLRSELLAYLDRLPGCRPSELLLDSSASLRVR
ncbi:helix-turn-helix domain-containing protein [Nitrospira calida]|jgi:excisionase family DNA binding protein